MLMLLLLIQLNLQERLPVNTININGVESILPEFAIEHTTGVKHTIKISLFVIIVNIAANKNI